VRRLVFLCVAAATVLASCGPSGSEETPQVCLGPADDFLAALEDAPGMARLDGGTRISDCLTDGQPAAQLNQVGQSMVAVATRLNRQAQSDPSGETAVRLGYLMGAANRGAAGTSGIHADLVRRINSAARYSAGGGSLPSAFEQAYGRGYAAGRRDG
jgi:hypothetical protein